MTVNVPPIVAECGIVAVSFVPWTETVGPPLYWYHSFCGARSPTSTGEIRAGTRNSPTAVGSESSS
ncbi:hypothetical protein [Actinoplanes sp. NPDC026619]|uniref:hypothetical protein n=1 Tax=Actinoplanes sp. NPDC026619 TaxID=3155798 RepID=UPI0034021131